MKNLENYGVQSLNAKEIRGIDGGQVGETALAAIIAGAVINIINNWDSFKAGFATAFN